MTDRRPPDDVRHLREIFDEAEREHGPAGLGDPALADRFHERARALFRAYREREAGAVPASPGPSVSPGRAAARSRAFWTPLRLSLAVNVCLVAILLVGSSTWRHFLPLTTRLVVEGSRVTLQDTRFNDFETRHPKWFHEFPGEVSRAEVGPWAHGSRYVVVSVWDQITNVAFLTLWDFQADREVWTHAIETAELVPLYPAEMASAGIMHCIDFDFPDLAGDGEPEIAAAFRQTMFLPACVRTLSVSGEVLGTYYNWGYLEDVMAADLDGDGRDEILAAGTNNAPAYQGGTVILLDRDHLSGASADDQVWTDAGVEDGSLARVVFPQFEDDIRDMLHVTRLHAWAIRLRPPADPASGEGPTVYVDLGVSVEQSRPWLVPYMDRTLRPIRVVMTDLWMMYAREYVKQGKLDPRVLEPEFGQEWVKRAAYFGKLPPVRPES